MISPPQVGLLLFVSALILLTYVFPTVGVEVRWAMYVLLLILVGWILVRLVRRDTVPVPPFGMTRRPDPGTSDELDRLVAALGRADRGMRYSQGQVIQRLRRAYLSKLALERGLTPREADGWIARPGPLPFVEDPTVRTFLERSAGAETLAVEGQEGTASPVPSGETTTRFLRRVLRAMGAGP